MPLHPAFREGPAVVTASQVLIGETLGWVLGLQCPDTVYFPLSLRRSREDSRSCLSFLESPRVRAWEALLMNGALGCSVSCHCYNEGPQIEGIDDRDLPFSVWRQTSKIKVSSSKLSSSSVSRGLLAIFTIPWRDHRQ